MTVEVKCVRRTITMWRVAVEKADVSGQLCYMDNTDVYDCHRDDYEMVMFFFSVTRGVLQEARQREKCSGSLRTSQRHHLKVTSILRIARVLECGRAKRQGHTEEEDEKEEDHGQPGSCWVLAVERVADGTGLRDKLSVSSTFSD